MISLFVLMINSWRQALGFKSFLNDGVAAVMACIAESLLELIGISIWEDLK